MVHELPDSAEITWDNLEDLIIILLCSHLLAGIDFSHVGACPANMLLNVHLSHHILFTYIFCQNLDET